ncbi:MAG: DUF2262 domain-containing protein [Planctomycetota bacterium]|jgi:hypothetical protein
MEDSDLGTLTWDAQLEGWEGSIQLSSKTPFHLYIFARTCLAIDRDITKEARLAIAKMRSHELACRRYAAEQLLAIHNAEWAEGRPISAAEFERRLKPDSLEIHESGYSEIHFGDDELFWGHSVGVRLRANGDFQEAVIEG